MEPTSRHRLNCLIFSTMARLVSVFAVLLATPAMAQLGGLLGGENVNTVGGLTDGLLGGGGPLGGLTDGLLGGGGPVGGLLGGDGLVGGAQNALGDLLNQLGLGTPNMEGGDGASLLGQALGAGVGIDLLSGPRCNVNETRVKCADPNEPKCGGSTSSATGTGTGTATGTDVESVVPQQSGSPNNCLPNKCQCKPGFVRTADGAQCVAQADCGSTTGTCAAANPRTGERTCQVDCAGSRCPTGWVCRKPNICLGAPCRAKCLPNYGVLNVDAVTGLGK